MNRGFGLAWKYLFPGVAAMLLFVAFPLVYTMQNGVTTLLGRNEDFLVSVGSGQGLLINADDVPSAWFEIAAASRTGSSPMSAAVIA